MKKLVMAFVFAATTFSASAAVIEVPSEQSTIQSALNVSAAGDTIVVSPGTYAEGLVYPTHRVTVLSSDGPYVTFLTSPGTDQGQTSYPSQYADTFSVAVDAINFIQALDPDSGSSFEGFTVTGVDGYQCIFYSLAATYFEISNNRFVDNGSYDVIRGGDLASLLISRNLIANSMTGNAVVTTGSDCSFINNTVDGGPRGLAIYGPISKVLNNIVVNIDWYAIWNPSPTTVVDYNDFWSNGDNGNPGTNGISSDPLFVDAGVDNYNLQDISPCVDAGHPDAIYFDPDGSRNDMGAYPLITGLGVSNLSFVSEDPGHLVNHTPTILWTFYDPEGSTQEAYEIEVGTDNEWSVAEMWATGEVVSPEASVVYSGEVLEDGQTYYLRIRISNGDIWCDWRVFEFTMNSLPTAPVPVYPIAEEEVRYNTLSLRVANASDTEGDELRYDFEIYGDAGLTELVDSEYGVEQQADQTSSSVVLGLQPGQQYWWRARCYDGYECSLWSGTESFVTASFAPIRVPEDYLTIQEAISVASNGDVVLVGPGVYNETISFLGKDITVVSSGGSGSTSIQTSATDSPPALNEVSDSTSVMSTDGPPTVSFISGEGETAVLDGFTIRNPSGRGIYCSGSSPVIMNCEIRECSNGGDGAGIWCENSGARILNNIIHDNQGGLTSAGVGGKGSVTPEIAYNTFHSNTAANGSAIGFVYPTWNVNIHHNILMNNSSPPERLGAIYVNGNNSSIINNTVVANHTSGISILGGGGIDIRNNIVVSNDELGISCGSASVDYNDVWDNAAANLPGPHGISADPLFYDEANHDYNLLSESPCIDAGDPDPIYRDPDGSRNDMGALSAGLSKLHVQDIHFVSEALTNVVGHTPTIAWTFYDPDGDTQAAFEIEVGTDSDWSVAEKWATGEVTSPESDIVYSGEALEDGHTYYLRIRVSDGVEWSDWRVLAFRMNSLPSAPTPVYPVAQAEVRTDGAFLQIANSIDLENDVLVYDFEVFADAALSVKVAANYGVEEQADITVSDLIEGLEPDQMYWWVARAHDGWEQGAWSAAETFIAKEGWITIKVPQDYTLIQRAIEFAMPGDVVLVSPGTYTEVINFMGKDITVVSSEGSAVTVIQSSDTDMPLQVENVTDSSMIMQTDAPPTVSFTSGETSGAVLDGFTIHNPTGHGIYCRESSPVIQNCDISGCYNGGDGAGIWCYYSAATIRNNVIHHNQGGNTSAGVGGQGSVAPEVSYNVIYENESPHGAGIGFIAPVSNLNVHHNLVWGNVVESGGQAAVYMNGSNSRIINNTVVDNVKGISILNGAGVVIYNNISAFNAIDGLVPEGAVFDYNDVYGNGASNLPGPNGISADPLFIEREAHNYHLLPVSPCINAGHPDAIYNDPDGSRNDIGAYWYFGGAISGVVSADDYGLQGVVLDLFDQSSAHLASALTDENGLYFFTDTESGMYTVSLLTPLGFYIDQEFRVVELIDVVTDVDFVLTVSAQEATQRTRGFWAHQIAVAMSEVDGTQVYRDELCESLEQIRTHFNDNRANPITAYEVLSEASCDDRLAQLNTVIAPLVGEGFTDAAIAQFATLLLNIASDKLWQRAVISEDGAMASQAVTQCDLLITDNNLANDSLARIIAETINKGQVVAAGLVDLSLPLIMYKELEGNLLPGEFSLGQNYPNPFNPSTQINFALPEAARVRLDIFNILGQRIARLVDETMEAGYHTVTWDGSKFSSGIYLYRLHAGDFVESKKMILVK